MTLKTASVLAFERKLDPSDALFFAGSWDDRNNSGAWPPVEIKVKSVRGTISNRLKTKDQDPAKLDAAIENPNLQTVDVATLRHRNALALFDEFVRGGELWTSSSLYSFKGITQGSVVAAWRGAGGVARECDFTLAQVYSADEAFCTGTLLSEWQGNLFMGALAGTGVWRLTLGGNTITAREKLDFSELATRIRDIRQGPDGALYALTDGSGGRIVRIAR